MVFVVSACRGIIPLERNNSKEKKSKEEEEKVDIEEERRLLFVAMSRPKTHLHITFSRHLSPFLDDILRGNSSALIQSSEIDPLLVRLASERRIKEEERKLKQREEELDNKRTTKEKRLSVTEMEEQPIGNGSAVDTPQ